MSKIDDWLKEIMQEASRDRDKSSELKAPEEYYRYVAGEMSSDEVLGMQKHLQESAYARQILLAIRTCEPERIAQNQSSEVPKDWILKAGQLKTSLEAKNSRCPKCGRGGLGRGSSAIFYILSGTSFLISFLMPKYFIQFSVIGALLALKAILDHRIQKTQVFVYKGQGEDKNRIAHDTEQQKRLFS